MVDPTSDPVPLLSPSADVAMLPPTLDLTGSSGSPLTSVDPTPPAEVSGSSKQSSNDAPFFISIPFISDEQKALYDPDFGHRLMSNDDQFDQEEFQAVIGEYSEGRKLYYFAKASDGMAYKFLASEFDNRHPDLVEDYEQKKAAGTLPPFDPSASYIHPASRVRMVLKIGKKTASKKRGTRRNPSNSDELTTSSGLDSQSEQSESSAWGDNRTAATRPKRSTRSAASTANKRPVRDLPFSPKKQKRHSITSYFRPRDSEFDSDSDVQEIPMPTRRSTRSTKNTRASLDDGRYTEDGRELSSDVLDNIYDADFEQQVQKPKKKNVMRTKTSRPAYGRFRHLVEIYADDDEETAPLRAHRGICEKCHRKPTTDLLADAHEPKKGRRKKIRSDEEDEDDIARIRALGGWVRCMKCPVTAHWGCLARSQRDEILKAAFERDRAEWKVSGAAIGQSADDQPVAVSLPEPTRRTELNPRQVTEFICGSCMKGGVCMMCKEVVIKPDSHLKLREKDNNIPSASNVVDGDAVMADAATNAASTFTPPSGLDEDGPGDLLFRCLTCKRLAHYEHLPVPSDHKVESAHITAVDLAEYYQKSTDWQCADCASYTYTVDHILAWRPFPENAIEPPRTAGEPVNFKAMLPREYLIKWVDRSYRRTSWVPHGWLLATHTAKLKNFLSGRTKVSLLPEAINEENVEGPQEQPATFEIGKNDAPDESSEAETTDMALLPNPDAERKIPPSWKTVGRVLDVLLGYPEKRLRSTGVQARGSRKKKWKRAVSEQDPDEDNQKLVAAKNELTAVVKLGEQPSDELTETVDEYEERTRGGLSDNDIDRVVWAFVKWDGLGYEDSSWDSPPGRDEPGYAAFESAFKRYITARHVQIPRRSEKEASAFDNRKKNAWRKTHAFTDENQPQLGQSPQLKLMPFQVDGVNWLCDNWWNHQSCILADEMGLGKTVQIATFIGHVLTVRKAYPALIVVPNSTISNWVREFERWAPELRVVPFYGESKAREIIKSYELFHKYTERKTTGAKFHVLVTTYEMITNPKEFTPVFKNTPRWEILVVDEGQRLKSDASLIFKRLKELNTIQRVIMTGTPLNNNVRELFTLMNFLDPGEWSDLDALSKEYEELSEDNIRELHTRLKPYFLRRIKSEVLQLPPKNEVIVPVSMAPLQKEVYRSILSQNLNILRNLAQGSMGATVNAALSKSKTSMNNVLMQLRKCLQHPYLISREIEPKGLSPQETHAKLIDASSKLGLLKLLLPKLHERQHRVLLFSQFSIALDIIEDFLTGEGFKHLRLDGSTKQADRQKGMDEFNRPGSDVFIYLLTTRAGGVGINLWTADTIIIFDPDFNPHQDLQAIARAHRYGQKKTCLVFKLMVKSSAEDKIMQTGKKKLVLDHLIVQKMDDVDGSNEDMQSILMFGAKALFEEGEGTNDQQIHYSEQDIDKLIEKTEKEGDQVEPEVGAGGTFSFAKVWSAEKDSLEEIADDAPDAVDQVDSWAQTLERLAAERAKVEEQEVTGRGVRRRAAAVFPQQQLDIDEGPENNGPVRKRKQKKSKSIISDDSDAYAASLLHSDSDTGDSEAANPFARDDLDVAVPLVASSPQQLPQKRTPMVSPILASSSTSRASVPLLEINERTSQPLSPIVNQVEAVCGLCGTQHGDTQCFMTNSPENLAQYRLMLLLHAGDESLQDRRAAIQAIDEALFKRGKIHLIYGQPLRLVEQATKATKPTVKKHKKDGLGLFEPSQPPTLPTNGKQSKDALSVKKDVPLLDDTLASDQLSVESSRSFAIVKPRPVPHASSTPNAVAGPSKRSLSPVPSTSSQPKKKRVKDRSTNSCAICGRSPHHLAKDCPIVAEGPKSVERAIKQLEGDPTQANLISALRSILKKLRHSGGH